MSATVQGAEYGSVIPGAGTLVGGAIGSMFGGGGSPGPTDAQHMQDVQAAINQDYQTIFGRAPTSAEIAQAVPYYWAGGPGGSGGRQSGMAYLGNLYQQQQNTPENLFQQQQKQLQDAYTGQQSKIDPQVSSIFQQNLGRAPTPEEAQHFGLLIASGQDPYQIQQALQQTTEYQTNANKKFNDQLTGQLQQSNQDYFNKYLLPSIQSQMANAGRSYDSSAFSGAVANAGKQQNYDLNNFLAQSSAANYGNSVANANNQYQALLGQQYGLQNAGVSNGLQNSAYNQQAAQQMSMYNLQQQAYSNYLSQYGKRSGNQGLGQLAGGLAGAGLGAYFGGGTGALQGYQIGSGVGGSAGAYL